MGKIIQMDYLFFSSELLTNEPVLEKMTADFMAKPIVLKDKRRNPALYEVENNVYVEQMPQNFEKGIYHLRRNIIKKVSK